jgi:hypothetical protein
MNVYQMEIKIDLFANALQVISLYFGLISAQRLLTIPCYARLHVENLKFR